MALKMLRKFVSFNFKAFADGKVFKVVECKPWLDWNTKEKLGTNIETIIAADKTNYLTDDETVSNAYEKLSFKISKEINVPRGTVVMPVDPKCVVYGTYQNQLSVKAADIEIINPQNK